MAIVPRIQELFGVRPPAAPLSPAQLSTAIVQQQQTGGTMVPGTSQNGNPTVPNATTPQSDGSTAAIPAASTGDASPLASYKELWNTNINTGVTNLVPEIQADPASMMAAAQKMDFTKIVDPAMVTKATQGDATALVGIINQVAQASFAQAAMASANITRAALTKQAETFETKYAPNMLRNSAINTEVQAKIPLSADPAAAPIVTALTRQLSGMYPTATAGEIATHVENYLTDFARGQVEASGGRIQTKSDLTIMQGPLSRGKDEDWLKFFDVDASQIA